jgi:hypothetical protein
MTQSHLSFDDEFLQSVAEAFRRRRKALNHRASRADCQKVYEVSESSRTERLEIYLEDGTRQRGALLRLHAWPDRWIWVDARRSTKTGWAWEWTYEGRLLGKHAGQDVVEALEKTYDLLPSMDAALTQELVKPWKRLLAKGPLEIHLTPN